MKIKGHTATKDGIGISIEIDEDYWDGRDPAKAIESAAFIANALVIDGYEAVSISPRSKGNA